jgi:hypothetical protein
MIEKDGKEKAAIIEMKRRWNGERKRTSKRFAKIM